MRRLPRRRNLRAEGAVVDALGCEVHVADLAVLATRAGHPDLRDHAQRVGDGGGAAWDLALVTVLEPDGLGACLVDEVRAALGALHIRGVSFRDDGVALLFLAVVEQAVFELEVFAADAAFAGQDDAVGSHGGSHSDGDVDDAEDEDDDERDGAHGADAREEHVPAAQLVKVDAFELELVEALADGRHVVGDGGASDEDGAVGFGIVVGAEP